MQYISTRGKAESLNFEDALLTGLAKDGGLYVPETLPEWDDAFLRGLSGKSYEEIAFAVMWPFVESAFSETEFREIIQKSYADFGHKARAPLKQIGDNQFLLELFHGPTLAFKDFAMQLIGRMFQSVLKKRGQRITIVGATSGDTGSAAIEAFKGLDNVDVFILFPEGRVSPVQQRQMTTPAAENINSLAVKGDFDDCQALLKAAFNDHKFRDEVGLAGVNSINWGRILAQIVYYVTSAVSLGAPDRKISFSVPTGNFGDIYAGYLAKKMGLPIDRLIIATNQNDILHRTLETGAHEKTTVTPSISPSMDIQVSSNFERLIFDLYDQNGALTAETFEKLKNEGGFHLGDNALERLRAAFSSARASEADTKATIRQIHADTAEVICPHSATGVFAANAHKELESPIVVLATAHPAKFPDAVEEATGIRPDLPPFLADLFEKKERLTPLENDLEALKTLILKART